jgi:GT2 family glycosyltransferase
VQQATGDVVLFLDDDAVANEGWLDAHLSAYAVPGVAGTAGMVRPAWELGAPPDWWPELFDWVVGCNDERSEPSGATVRNPVGANMGFRRKHVVDAGGFSHRLGRTSDAPLGCEETELAIRIVQSNPDSRVVFVREAECVHKVRPERATWRYFRARCVAEGRSKAIVATMTGLSAATAAERSYTRSVLKNAAADVVRPKRLRRTLAAVAGLGFALAGFMPGLLRQRRATHSARR